MRRSLGRRGLFALAGLDVPRRAPVGPSARRRVEVFVVFFFVVFVVDVEVFVVFVFVVFVVDDVFVA